MRAVLDTNVHLSGLLRKGSNADKLREAWTEKRFTLVTSEWQLAELKRVSRYPKLKKYLAPYEVGRLVGQIYRYATVVEGLPTIEHPSDHDDNPILATAIVGRAQYLVTGDRRHLLNLGKVEEVQLVAPIELVTILEL